MFKSKFQKFVIAFSIFVITLLFLSNINYANYFSFENNDKTDWRVVITSDTKEISDKQEIKFKVEENKNVVNGKIAPGLKATSSIEIDIAKTKVPVDIKVIADTSNLPNSFKLTSKLNGENYALGSNKTISPLNSKEFTEKDGKIILTLELEFVSSEENTIIGTSVDKITLPITLNIREHI